MNIYLLISLPGGSGWFVLLLVAALSFFWIAALLDVIRNKFDSRTTKITWLLVVILLGFLGALIYEFAGKRSRLT